MSVMLDTLIDIVGILFLSILLLNIVCIAVLCLFGVNLIEVFQDWLKRKGWGT